MLSARSRLLWRPNCLTTDLRMLEPSMTDVSAHHI